MQPAVVDLFSGAGGLALGAAMSGFEVVASVEIDETLHSSFSKNFSSTKTINQDVAQLDASSWESILPVEFASRFSGVLGGPPCQGFSRIGHRQKDDPRNSLVTEYFRQVSILSPDFFVFENVEGILDDESRPLLDAGIDLVTDTYDLLGPITVNAADYGAATNRKRVLIVGTKKGHGVFNLPKPHTKRADVRSAIFDLPLPASQGSGSREFEWAKYSEPDGRSISSYARKSRKIHDGIGSEHSISMLRKGQVSGNLETIHTQDVINRFKNVEQGKTDQVSRSKRLEWGGLAPTLRSGTGSEHGSYQAVRPLHPTEPRVITVREAARLQGFPDWFLFHPTKWHSFRMIGNSVSPRLSEALLSSIYSQYVGASD